MNRIQIIGNLTRDVEINTYGEHTVAKASVAVNERVKVKNGAQDEWKDGEPVYFTVTLWGRKSAKIAGLKKGTQIMAEGKISLSVFKKKDGETGASLEIKADTAFACFTPKLEPAAAPEKVLTGSEWRSSAFDAQEIPF